MIVKDNGITIQTDKKELIHIREVLAKANFVIRQDIADCEERIKFHEKNFDSIKVDYNKKKRSQLESISVDLDSIFNMLSVK